MTLPTHTYAVLRADGMGSEWLLIRTTPPDTYPVNMFEVVGTFDHAEMARLVAVQLNQAEERRRRIEGD